MTAFRRSGDSVSAVPAPSENISANFFRAKKTAIPHHFRPHKKNDKLFPRRKKRRSFIISDRAEKISPCGLSKRMEKTEIVRHTRPRGKNPPAACPNTRKKPKLRGISNRVKRYNPCCLSKGGGRRLYGKGKPFSGGKNAEKFRLFTEFFVDASGNGVMTFEQVGGAGESFVGRKKSAGGDGGGGGGIGAAGCGLILWIGGRSRVNVFVVGGG